MEQRINAHVATENYFLVELVKEKLVEVPIAACASIPDQKDNSYQVSELYRTTHPTCIESSGGILHGNRKHRHKT